MITIDQAWNLLLERVVPFNAHSVSLGQAVGRVLAKPILADLDSPPHRKSLMDGFAVRSGDINSGLRRLKVVETIVAGGWPQRSIATGEAARIMTGAPLPDGADAVVMVEKTETSETSNVSWVAILVDQLTANQHVIQQGGHFGSGQELFPAGHRIRATDIGLIAEAGAAEVTVSTAPRVAILPTGNELVACQFTPSRGQIRNSNGPMLAALCQELGLETKLMPICSDDTQELEEQIRIGLQHDLLLLTGGVSEGLLDLVPRTLQRLGVQEGFHKVHIKPGKPIWFGVLDRSAISTKPAVEQFSSVTTSDRCYVFGLPGNPVSSLVGFQLFVRTAIRCLEGIDLESKQVQPARFNEAQPRHQHPCLPQFVMSTMTKDHETRGDRPTFWPGRWLNHFSSVRRVEPLGWKGSSDLLALGQADGMIYFSCQQSITRAGTEVAFFPFA